MVKMCLSGLTDPSKLLLIRAITEKITPMLFIDGYQDFVSGKDVDGIKPKTRFEEIITETRDFAKEIMDRINDSPFVDSILDPKAVLVGSSKKFNFRKFFLFLF